MFDYYTQIVFCQPDDKLIQWMIEKFPRQTFVDCGAGTGHFSACLKYAGAKVIAIDLFPSPESPVPIRKYDASRFPFVKNMVPILARPNRGDWIRRTIDAAVSKAGMMLYVGRSSHEEEDLTPLPYRVQLVMSDIGEDHDNAWLITPLESDEECIPMKREFERVLAIKYQGSPVFVGIKNGNKHWGCSFSNCPFNPETDIVLADYAAIYDGTPESIDACEQRFLSHFGPKPQIPSARIGMIAPNGDFYPCAYSCHRDLADKLSTMFCNSSGGIRDLAEAGWISINGDGIVCRKGNFSLDDKATDRQIETLRDIYAAFAVIQDDAAEFMKALHSNPEGYDEQMWFTQPDINNFMSDLSMSIGHFSGDSNEEEIPIIITPPGYEEDSDKLMEALVDEEMDRLMGPEDFQ